ncbi:hypothetical protein [Tenacibaculum sp. SZ-18]|uniref:hypothetical protein n=1 Tax=Tenacibaculum sp. SZ-18 TaxID=754423 RepID=UPI0012FE1CE0|nr:hypothetical protein [Tenacibaculum sp. SZ-18]
MKDYFVVSPRNDIIVVVIANGMKCSEAILTSKMKDYFVVSPCNDVILDVIANEME